jgi:hypothetical protein
MKGLGGAKLRTGLALGALAVALVASVSGREQPGADLAAPARVEAQAASPKTGATEAQTAAPSAEEIDLAKLRRPKNDVPIAELFGPADPPARQPAGPVGRAARASAAMAAHSAAEPPAEPPLPFQYLGKVIDEGRISVFLASGAAHYSVRQGQAVNDEYRVDAITEAAVAFTHLSTGRRQVLAIPPMN